MGGGNGQKSAKAREKNAAKAAKGKKGSELAANAAAMSIVCAICRQSFSVTMNQAKLQEHVDSKHSKNTPKECFPDKF